MNHKVILGRNFTIRIFASVLLISIYTIVTYQLLLEHTDTKKLVQQIIRFGLTILLMYFVFKGKKWAVNVITVLFSLSIFISAISIFSVAWPGHIPLLVMIAIYSIAVYHLNYSENFKTYFTYLQDKNG
ncbi:hypothetical protein GR160_15475 [Flavobacterium sp. Sd200]|uniref:hypothetical protein n=1 Tax=Flavobacterium sp. Sd200 TaxID=2692211 RepID=UPI001371EA76|nr:hypothetical protein [Flavobacterium sp. Sd200]MXN92629.1 hypothetical protein [Flavobacterium sp. Sd200]